MKCRTYLCRWPNGEFSIVTAGTREDAVAKLDEWAGAEASELIELESFMAHFRLNDDGKIELAELGEDIELRVWAQCYPELNRLLSSDGFQNHEDEELTPAARELLRAAVSRERDRMTEGELMPRA
jgi:hypothetical protein